MQSFRFMLTILAWPCVLIHLIWAAPFGAIISFHAALTYLLRILIPGGGYLFSVRRRAMIASPQPKTRRVRPATQPVNSWRKVVDIDGVPFPPLVDVSFRWKHLSFPEVKMQGSLQMERFSGTTLHRLTYNGCFSLQDANHCAVPGPQLSGALYFPPGAMYDLKELKGQTERTSTKIFGMRCTFEENPDGLEFFQIVVKLGNGEQLTMARRFQDHLDVALDAGVVYDEFVEEY